MLDALRRRIALTICPELMLQKQVIEAREGFVPSARVEHVIRLGNLMLAGTGATDFLSAAGLKRRLPGRRDNPPATEEYDMAIFLGQEWRPVAKRPCATMTDRVYERFLRRFSTLWPEDLPWPADIPRPPKARKEAA